MALGIPVGAYLYNELGAIIGAAVFGVCGSLLGENIMMSAEEKLNKALMENSGNQETRVPTIMPAESFHSKMLQRNSAV